jgi:hypothetical protein
VDSDGTPTPRSHSVSALSGPARVSKHRLPAGESGRSGSSWQWHRDRPGQAGSDWLRPGSTRPAVASLRGTGPRQGCTRVLFVLYTRTCCSGSRALTRSVQVPSPRDVPVLVTCACPARAPTVTPSIAMVRILSESCQSPVCSESLARALCPFPAPRSESIPSRSAQHLPRAQGKRYRQAHWQADSGDSVVRVTRAVHVHSGPSSSNSESGRACQWHTGNARHRRTRKIHSGSCERQGVVKQAREKTL